MQNKLTKLIWVCAWCGSKARIPLKKRQQYTHGICSLHKKQVIAELARA